VEWKILQLAKSSIIQQIAARSNLPKSVINGAQGSHNTITLGNLQPLTAMSMSQIGSGIMWDEFSNTNHVKKYEVFETTEDVLALSVTWHRLRPLLSHNINIISNPSSRPSKLTDEILFREMIQEDRERANIIRDYYSKKLMMINLRGQRISKYRKDLSIFIHGDGKIVKEEFMPLIYRLPEFYDYDISTDEMFRSLDTRFEDTRIALPTIKTVSPIDKFLVKRKTGKYNEYWLRDEQNRPCRIEIEHSNQLMHLWDYFFKKKSVTLDCISKFEERDNIAFYKIVKWTIQH
jgi:hypothetical protein